MIDSKSNAPENLSSFQANAKPLHFEDAPLVAQSNPLNLPAMHPLAFMRLGDSSFFDRIREKLRKLRGNPSAEPEDGKNHQNEDASKENNSAQNPFENITRDLKNDKLPMFLRMFTRVLPVKMIKVIKVDSKATSDGKTDAPILSTDINEKVFSLTDGHVKKIAEHNFHNEQKSPGLDRGHAAPPAYDALTKMNLETLKKIRENNHVSSHSASEDESSEESQSAEADSKADKKVSAHLKDGDHKNEHDHDRDHKHDHKKRYRKHSHRLSFFASCKDTVGKYIEDYASPRNVGIGAAGIVGIFFVMLLFLRLIKKFKGRKGDEKPSFEYRSLRNQSVSEEPTSALSQYRASASYSHLAASSVFLSEENEGAMNSV